MKTKTDAAKVLMEKGWTFEEVERVLGKAQGSDETDRSTRGDSRDGLIRQGQHER
jgi:hypothetical protein